MKENKISVVTKFPRKVREIENVFIPLAEGIRLAARIWLPEDAEQDPVPAILEFLPYMVTHVFGSTYAAQVIPRAF